MEMKLKEKSGVIELFHHTSSQFLMENIIKEGYINNDINNQGSSENHICLSNDIFNSAGHSEEAIKKGDPNKLNLNITLVIKVQTENLIPHYDLLRDLDRKVDNNNPIPLWNQSLNLSEECTCNKPITVDSIDKVLFQSLDLETLDGQNKKFNGDHEKLAKFLLEYLDEELSVKEAYEGLLKVQEAYDKI